MTRTADAVVVGGGVIGCAIARELVRRGRRLRVVLLERSTLGGEATSAAAGLVAPQAEAEGPGVRLRLGVASRARWIAWAGAVMAESGIDVELRTNGVLYVAFTAADARVLVARARWQRAAGLRVVRVAAPARLVPGVARGVRLALHFPEEHRVNNERLALALGLAARSAGAEVVDATAVTAVLARRGRVVGVETTAGAITVPIVIDAAGAWAGRVGLPPGVVPPPLFPVRGQMFVLRGPLGILPCPLYSRRGYLVPRVDGRILAGSTYERAGYEKRTTAGAAADILAAARAMLPAAADMTLESMHAGLRPATPDHLPVIGPAADLRGLFYATGHYRSGILLAPITAVAIADLVLDGSTAVPLRGLGPARFRRRRR